MQNAINIKKRKKKIAEMRETTHRISGFDVSIGRVASDRNSRVVALDRFQRYVRHSVELASGVFQIYFHFIFSFAKKPTSYPATDNPYSTRSLGRVVRGRPKSENSIN